MEERRQVRLGRPVKIGKITITPVVKTVVTVARGGNGRMFQAIMLPLGCLVAGPQGRKAFRTSGEEVDPDDMEKSFPGLRISAE